MKQTHFLIGPYEAGEKRDLAAYRAAGGYASWERVRSEMSAESVREEVKAAGVRGRGGAGFPAGVKWGFVPQDTGKPIYLCCNADESEPGTFKDRMIIEFDPHRMIEGCLIACHAIGSKCGYIYVRREFDLGIEVTQAALAEARAAGLVGGDNGVELHIHVGAGAYICGEETSLLNSIEGKRPYPRNKPPFPAVEGLFGCPTIVNNVETLASVPLIIEKGADWFRSMGTSSDPGFRLYSVSGHVNDPKVVEVEIGATVNEVIELCGGVRDGHALKGVIVGGSSVPILLPDACDTPMDAESLQEAGTFAGSSGFMVLDDSVCMVEALGNLLAFYTHESCGQCTPCREGIHWTDRVVARIEAGEGREGDLDMLLDLGDRIAGKTVCALADGAVMPLQSYIRLYRDEFEAHITSQGCPMKGVSAGTEKAEAAV